MRNSDLTRPFRMFELMMVSFCMMENPTVTFEPLYYFPATHDVYHTHWANRLSIIHEFIGQTVAA